jgi:hypothetical protein
LNETRGFDTNALNHRRSSICAAAQFCSEPELCVSLWLKLAKKLKEREKHFRLCVLEHSEKIGNILKKYECQFDEKVHLYCFNFSICNLQWS